MTSPGDWTCSLRTKMAKRLNVPRFLREAHVFLGWKAVTETNVRVNPNRKYTHRRRDIRSYGGVFIHMVCSSGGIF